jgi:hypothetical protein
MLNNVVNSQEQHGQQNIVQACFQQHCYRLGVFSCAFIFYNKCDYFLNYVYPNPPCQLSLWEETRAPVENPRLSAKP